MNSNARSPWPAPTTTDFLPTVDPVNNWKPGGHCPPYELFREAEAFAFLGANDVVHNESLNVESADGGRKYFDPLTQFYRTPKTTETWEK